MDLPSNSKCSLLFPPKDLAALTVPPGHLSERDRLKCGQDWCRILQKLDGLTPESSVLEVGFGEGRVARVVADFTAPLGKFTGIEPIKELADWHIQHIESVAPHTTFLHADVFNGAYSPEQTLAPTEYTFPFDDDQFDIVYLLSVFTHMLPADIAHYLSEIRRVLKPGGVVLSSWFVVDKPMHEFDPRPEFLFVQAPGHNGMTWRRDDYALQEWGTGYSPELIEDTYKDAGLTLTDFWIQGKWRRIPSVGLTGQDIIIGRCPGEVV